MNRKTILALSLFTLIGNISAQKKMVSSKRQSVSKYTQSQKKNYIGFGADLDIEFHNMKLKSESIETDVDRVGAVALSKNDAGVYTNSEDIKVETKNAGSLFKGNPFVEYGRKMGNAFIGARFGISLGHTNAYLNDAYTHGAKPGEEDTILNNLKENEMLPVVTENSADADSSAPLNPEVAHNRFNLESYWGLNASILGGYMVNKMVCLYSGLGLKHGAYNAQLILGSNDSDHIESSCHRLGLVLPLGTKIVLSNGLFFNVEGSLGVMFSKNVEMDGKVKEVDHKFKGTLKNEFCGGIKLGIGYKIRF
ncbi:hypothetical protein [Candidatus Nesciobacter abundans]|uniref:Uncharacterized protein n=1 Tax=Candidatus Nesciobacter abundans TaxID=2601668 RepID=A0A5C0UHK9_9PROT|nr:hypothetical protein [Candidatus Nesciobacter abundans]QEK39180.1 hypothetical protein FZC36_01915 [Candidatus Nesciobacter abundans]